MDTRDGRIYDESQMRELFKELPKYTIDEFFRATKQPKKMRNSDLKFFKPMELAPTEKQMARKPPKIGRNEPCPCGSAKKFKKCCLIENWRERFNPK